MIHTVNAKKTDSRGKTVILVEDEPVFALSTAQEIATYGFTVKALNSGEDAIRYFSSGGTADLVLMDIDLGDGMDGTAAAGEILKVVDIPIIFLSSHSERLIVEKTENAYSFGYVIKDSGIDVLIASIKMAFRLFEANEKIRVQARELSRGNEELQASNEELRTANERLLRSERELSVNEEKYRRIFNDGPLATALLDGKFMFVDANTVFEQMMGYSLDELESMSFIQITHPDFVESNLEQVGRLKRGEIPVFRAEKKYVTKSGRILWGMAIISVLHDNSGEFRNFLAMVNDITERKKAEAEVQVLLAEKDTLLKEVHHRIKNNMNSIASLLSLQAGSSHEIAVQIALQEAGDRIRSMQVVYDRLYRSGDFRHVSSREYLSQLMMEIQSTLIPKAGLTLSVDFDDVPLDADTLIPIAIIVNELVSNAWKYAFPSGKGGRISASFSAGSGDFFILSVMDDGVGLPEGMGVDETSGFGFLLINALAEQLQGSFEFSRVGGTKFTLRFPSVPH